MKQISAFFNRFVIGGNSKKILLKPDVKDEGSILKPYFCCDLCRNYSENGLKEILFNHISRIEVCDFCYDLLYAPIKNRKPDETNYT